MTHLVLGTTGTRKGGNFGALLLEAEAAGRAEVLG